jgi:membrane associated rhomboid family serine protease
MTPRSGSQKNVFFGAIILLAWLGTGTERTDIVAHLTGFIAGFAIGALVGRSPRRPGTNSGRQ